jgi:hypothetical protein
MVLTHFGPVGDLERLSGDMHRDIDAFVRIAREHADDHQRAEAIARALFEHLSGRLDVHGYAGDARRRHEFLDPDIDLNTQGLEVWLARS